MPPVPAPSGRSAAPIAESTPSIAMALVSIRPVVISASTIAIRPGSNAAKMKGASSVWAKLLGGVTSNGQKNIRSPATDTSTKAANDRVLTPTTARMRRGAAVGWVAVMRAIRS